MRVLVVIPARYASTRLPGKPLLDICGKPMIQHVYEAASWAELVDQVIVATDDERIAEAVQAFGGQYRMTSHSCASGTDRLVEVARSEEADVYVNVQGDEPLIRPDHIDSLVRLLFNRPAVSAATPVYAVTAEAARDPNLVKVVRSDSGLALYFSRSVVPYDRDGHKAVRYWGHMGMYAYRRAALEVFANHGPSELEQVEKLEQLRLLQNGMHIATAVFESCVPGVDTLEDLERVRRVLSGEPEPVKDDTLDLESRLARVRLIITDVDGVLTDGGLYYGPTGECMKRFCAQDGLGITMLPEAGIQLAVLSGRDCQALRSRLKDLNVSVYRLGKVQKRQACLDLLNEAGVDPSEAVFIGDDLPDVDGFACCGLGVAVGNAHPEAKKKADLVLKASGGNGAFRELVDRLLAARRNEA